MNFNLNRLKQRRTLLKSLFFTTLLGFGSLLPKLVLAAWPKAAFYSKTVQSALDNLEHEPFEEGSKKVIIKAPKLAENGSTVWIEVSSKLKHVESITILVEKNPTPLCAKFILAKETEAFVYTRVKMRESSSVIAVVKADGKFYSAQKFVKVTIGGCGG